MKPVLIGIAFAALLSGAAIAAPPPDEVVKKATEDLQAAIATRQAEFKADRGKFYAVVDEMVAPHFDLPYITQLILARHGRSASPEQKQRFQAAFKNMLIRSYANALLEYGASVKTEWKPVHMADDAKTVTVHSRVIRPNGPPVPLGFAMRQSGDQWKVYDITIESVSLITGFRAQVASAIKNSSLDDVIARLEKGDNLGKPAG